MGFVFLLLLLLLLLPTYVSSTHCCFNIIIQLQNLRLQPKTLLHHTASTADAATATHCHPSSCPHNLSLLLRLITPPCPHASIH
jgi:hypothetical protein